MTDLPLLHPNLPYFAGPSSYNVMRTANSIRREKYRDWKFRLFDHKTMLRAALLQAWDAHRSFERDLDYRLARYGHLRFMTREQILERRARLKRDMDELQYYNRVPWADYDAAGAEIEVIDQHILPHI